MKLYYVHVWDDTWQLLPVIASSPQEAKKCAGYFGIVGKIIQHEVWNG